MTCVRSSIQTRAFYDYLFISLYEILQKNFNEIWNKAKGECKKLWRLGIRSVKYSSPTAATVIIITSEGCPDENPNFPKVINYVNWFLSKTIFTLFLGLQTHPAAVRSIVWREEWLLWAKNCPALLFPTIILVLIWIAVEKQ